MMEKISRVFWKQCIVWGIIVGIILGLFAAMLGSYRSQSEFVGLGIAGCLIGFATGFILKAIEKLPPKNETSFRSRLNFRGRQPDADEIIPDWEERKTGKF